MILQRMFSIQSGHPDKGGSLARELKNRAIGGAIVGGVLGAVPATAVGINIAKSGSVKDGLKWGGGILAGCAAFGIIANCLGSLGANSRRAKASRMTMDDILNVLYKNVRDADIASGQASDDIYVQRYIVEDGDPEKFMVTFAFEDGKGVIYFQKPTNPVISWFNNELELMIATDRKADYASQEIKNGYIVEVICPDTDAFAGIIYEFICEFKLRVSCLTTKTLNRVKDKNFSALAEEKNSIAKKTGIIGGSAALGAGTVLVSAKPLSEAAPKIANKIEWKKVVEELPKNKSGKPGLIVRPSDAYEISRGKFAEKVAAGVRAGGKKLGTLASTKYGKAGLLGTGALVGTLAGIKAASNNKKK